MNLIFKKWQLYNIKWMLTIQILWKIKLVCLIFNDESWEGYLITAPKAPPNSKKVISSRAAVINSTKQASCSFTGWEGRLHKSKLAAPVWSSRGLQQKVRLQHPFSNSRLQFIGPDSLIHKYCLNRVSRESPGDLMLLARTK